MNEFKDRMVSAEGWEGKMRPVNVNGMFFADDPDKMDGWGVGMDRRKNNWALWVDGKGFVCGGENMCWPVRPWPMTMSKEVRKYIDTLRETGVFFSFTTDPLIPETRDLTLSAISFLSDLGIKSYVLTKNHTFYEYDRFTRKLPTLNKE